MQVNAVNNAVLTLHQTKDGRYQIELEMAECAHCHAVLPFDSFGHYCPACGGSRDTIYVAPRFFNL